MKLEVRATQSSGGKAPAVFERGEISTFSRKAAARLRNWLLTMHVPGRKVLDVTLTIPGEVTPEEWDRIKRRFFMRLQRAGVAVVWRIELQKRKQPHLHLAAWVEDHTAAAVLFVNGWLECLPEENRNRRGAFTHAVRISAICEDLEQSAGWFAYLAGHATKNKASQLGWKGKQWGIINRGLFRGREELESLELTFDQHKTFRRVLRRFLHAKAVARWHSRGRKGKKPRPVRYGLGTLTRIDDGKCYEKLFDWLREV